jgi:hypothetical protein
LRWHRSRQTTLLPLGVARKLPFATGSFWAASGNLVRGANLLMAEAARLEASVYEVTLGCLRRGRPRGVSSRGGAALPRYDTRPKMPAVERRWRAAEQIHCGPGLSPASVHACRAAGALVLHRGRKTVAIPRARGAAAPARRSASCCSPVR